MLCCKQTDRHDLHVRSCVILYKQRLKYVISLLAEVYFVKVENSLVAMRNI